MEHEIAVTKESGTKNGYYVSYETMHRPYVAWIGGKPLLTKTGQVRRFAGVSSARYAAETFLKTGK